MYKSEGISADEVDVTSAVQMWSEQVNISTPTANWKSEADVTGEERRNSTRGSTVKSHATQTLTQLTTRQRSHEDGSAAWRAMWQNVTSDVLNDSVSAATSERQMLVAMDNHNSSTAVLTTLITNYSHSEPAISEDFTTVVNAEVSVDTAASHKPLLALLVPIAVSLLLNILVCCAIRSNKRLACHMTYYFLVSMAVLHIFMSAVLMPATLAVLFSGDFHYSEEVCKLWVTLDLFFCNNTCLHLAFTSMDTYLRLRDPPRHSASASTTCSLVLWLGAPWSISLMQAIAQFMLSQEDHGIINKGICFIADKNFLMLGTLFSFFIPVVISVGFYGLIAHEIRRAKKGRFLDDSEQGSLRADGRFGSEESAIDEEEALSDSTCASDVDEDRKPHEDVRMSVVNHHVNTHQTTVTSCACSSEQKQLETTSFCQEHASADIPQRSAGHVNMTFSHHTNTVDQTTSSSSLLMKTTQPSRAKMHAQCVLMGERHLTCPDESLRHELVISRMLLSLLLICLLFWTPFSISNIVYGVCKSCRSSMTFASSLTFKWLAYSSALTGPIMCLMLSTPLRNAFHDVLMCNICRPT